MSENRPTAGAAASADTYALCARLRSKKYFFLDGPPRDAEEITDGSCHFWCAATHQAIGPDHFSVAPQDCTAERTCYAPIFPSLT